MSKARELAELGAVYDSGALSNRNLIINGAMQVAQRGTSSTGLGGSTGYFTVDRFEMNPGGTATAGRFTMSQHSDGPDGFANCLKLDCTTADTSVAAGERLILRHYLEGQNVQSLAKGTSSAKKVTVSFYVKGNAAATYACSLYDNDNGRSVSQTFAVTTSWNRIELTFPADTSGSLDDDNLASLLLDIFLHAGSDYTSGTLGTSWASNVNANRAVGISSFFDSTSREFFITGIQMEVGEAATPFEHRSFGQELQLCQRYFAKSYNYGVALGTTTYTGMAYTTLREDNQGTGYVEKYDFQFPVRMRTNPTITTYDHTGNSGKVSYYEGSTNIANRTLTVNSNSDKQWGGYSDRTTTIGGWNAHWTADAEL